MNAVMPLSPPASVPLPQRNGADVAGPQLTGAVVRMTGFAAVFDTFTTSDPAPVTPLLPDALSGTLSDETLSLAEVTVEAQEPPPEPSIPLSATLSGQAPEADVPRDALLSGMPGMAAAPGAGAGAADVASPGSSGRLPQGSAPLQDVPDTQIDIKQFPASSPNIPGPAAPEAATTSRDLPSPMKEGRPDMVRLRMTPDRDGPPSAPSLSPPPAAERSAQTSAVQGALPDTTTGFLPQAEWAMGEAADASSSTPLQDLRRTLQETVTLHRMGEAPPPAERQMAAAISASASGRTDILLDPQELGRVRLSLEGDELALVLTIQAERADTADLLRRNADILLQEFRDAGYANLTFTFADPGQSADQSADQTLSLPDDDDESFAAAPPEMLAEVVALRPGTGTLDLRL